MVTRLSDLPKKTYGDLLEEYGTERDRWEWENYREPVGCLARVSGAFLWEHRSNEFPVDATPGTLWFDASGTYWSLHPDGTRWLNLSKSLNDGVNEYRLWDRETGLLGGVAE